MLRKSLAILSGAVLLSSVGAVVSSPSYAQSVPYFSCDTNNLTTVVEVGGRRGTVMRWRTNEFSDSGYNPVRRCREVSDRFNYFASKKQLGYITAGIVRGMPVVCAASYGGSCDSSNVLFTLNSRNSRNVAGILQTLFDNRAGAAGAVVNESSERVYIDVNKMLENLGDGSAAGQSGSDTSNDQPSAVPSGGNTTPSGGGW